MNILIGIFTLVLTTHAAFGSSVEKLDLRLRFNILYEDPSYTCSTDRLGVDVLIQGKIENEKLKSLKLSNFPKNWAYHAIYREMDLVGSDLSGFEVEKVGGRWWFTQIQNSEKVMKWVFNVGLARNFYCKLPNAIASTSASNLTNVFELDGVRQGVDVSYSLPFDVTGSRMDNQTYKATVRFIQRLPMAERFFFNK